MCERLHDRHRHHRRAVRVRDDPLGDRGERVGVHLRRRPAAPRGPCATPTSCRSRSRRPRRCAGRAHATTSRPRTSARRRCPRSRRSPRPPRSIGAPSHSSVVPAERADAKKRMSLDREGALAQDRAHHGPDLAGRPDDGDRSWRESRTPRRRARTPSAARAPRRPRARRGPRTRCGSSEVEIISMLMPCVGERLEHRRGDAGVRLHARADERHAADRRRRSSTDAAPISGATDSQAVARGVEVGLGDGERDVGQPVRRRCSARSCRR